MSREENKSRDGTAVASVAIARPTYPTPMYFLSTLSRIPLHGMIIKAGILDNLLHICFISGKKDQKPGVYDY